MMETAVPFRLSVRRADAEAMPNVYASFKTEPIFAPDVEEEKSVFGAVFPHLRDSVEDVLRSIQVMVGMPGMQARVNGRAIEDLLLFGRAVRCYRESLTYPIPTVHCPRQPTRVEDAAVCEDANCPIRCPFLSGACRRSEERTRALRPRGRYEPLVTSAEVHECPNLQRRVSFG